MNKKNILKYMLGIFLASVVIIISCYRRCYGNNKEEMFSKKPHLVKEAMAAAIKWKDAILNKQIDVLISFADPKFQEEISVKFKNKNSDVYISFLGNNSTFTIFSKIKKFKILLQDAIEVPDEVPIFDVYYYDADKMSHDFPFHKLKGIEFIKGDLLPDKGLRVQRYFYKFNKKWYTSYAIGH